MELKEAVKNEYDFRRYMENFFEEKEELEFGYDDGYYWEKWYVTMNRGNTGMLVEFDIGSGSGYIPMQFYVSVLSFEEFRRLLLNKKFEDNLINLVDIIGEVTEKADTVGYEEDY